MKNLLSLFVFIFIIMGPKSLYAQIDSESIKHVKVFYEPEMYGGWPANHGIWNWQNEILVGFSKGFHKDRGPERHSLDQDKTEFHLLARSLDGGNTWEIEDPGKLGGALVIPDYGGYHGVARKDVEAPTMRDCIEGINFKHSDFALTARKTTVHAGQSRFWYSYDRGRHWIGPCSIPNFGTQGTAARTDYIVNGAKKAMLFITAAKTNGKQGRPMVIQTVDGGKEWSFLSWIGSEPDGFSIMPASVRISTNEILVTVRRREGSDRFISAYLSRDNGQSWNHLNDPVEDTGIGNPPAIIKLQDGRIGLTYIYRSDMGSQLNFKLSEDNGLTWSNDIILRSDGAGRDAGYPRIVQLSNGKLVIIYYWNHSLLKNKPPYRYIAATIFDPPPKKL